MNADAESCYRRAITLLGEIYGADDPALTRPLQNLATLYLDQGQYAKAEGLQRRLLALKAGPGGPAPIESMRTLHLQAVILHSRRRYADAEGLYQKALSFGDQSHTDEAREATAAVLNNLAMLYIQTGRPTEAFGPLQRVLGVFENSLGQNHPSLVRPLGNLAAAYATLRRPADAAPILARALSIAESEFGTQDPTYGTLLSLYAVVLRQLNRKSEAKQYEARAKVILATAASRTAAGETVDVSDLVKPPARR
jgi:tetratricopeptide (TPR) repeat protein